MTDQYAPSDANHLLRRDFTRALLSTPLAALLGKTVLAEEAPEFAPKTDPLIFASIEKFAELNKTVKNPEQRSYASLIEELDAVGLKSIANKEEKGKSPSLIVLCANHIRGRPTEEEMRVFDYILKMHRAGDIFLPEGISAGFAKLGMAYGIWNGMKQYINLKHRKDDTFIDNNLEQIMNTSFVIGTEPLDLPYDESRKAAEVMNLFIKAYSLRKAGNKDWQQYQKQFEVKSAEYYPGLSQHQFTLQIRNLLDQVNNEGSDKRELEYWLPIIQGIDVAKKPNQIMFKTAGKAHVTKRKKFEQALEKQDFGYIIAVPKKA